MTEQKDNKKTMKQLREACTPKEVSYVLELVSGDHETEYAAFMASDYKTDAMKEATIRRNACAIKKKPHVKAYYEALMDKMMNKAEEKAITSKEDVLRRIVEVSDTAMQKVLVGNVEGPDGETRKVYTMMDYAAANASNRMLAQNFSMLTDKVEVKQDKKITVNFKIPRPKK